LRALGARDYRAGRLDASCAVVLDGVDFAFDGIGGANVGFCIGVLRRGGTLVGYGFAGARGRLSTLLTLARVLLATRLRGRRGAFYGITLLYRKDPRPFREDLPKIFAFLAERKIDPLIARRFPLLEARSAVELLAMGGGGQIVLEGEPPRQTGMRIRLLWAVSLVGLEAAGPGRAFVAVPRSPFRATRAQRQGGVPG
jgi:NADPH:quinone reductase-like Zn-dependent oxidoreductase